jgi:hypothetical protein
MVDPKRKPLRRAIASNPAGAGAAWSAGATASATAPAMISRLEGVIDLPQSSGPDDRSGQIAAGAQRTISRKTISVQSRTSTDPDPSAEFA